MPGAQGAVDKDQNRRRDRARSTAMFQRDQRVRAGPSMMRLPLADAEANASARRGAMGARSHLG